MSSNLQEKQKEKQKEKLSILASLETLGTKEGFVAFVNSQDPEERINHSTWESCAVGDYARSLGIAVDPEGHTGYLSEFAGRILNEAVLEVLNVGGCDWEEGQEDCSVETYGGLSAFIKLTKENS